MALIPTAPVTTVTAGSKEGPGGRREAPSEGPGPREVGRVEAVRGAARRRGRRVAIRERERGSVVRVEKRAKVRGPGAGSAGRGGSLFF